MKWAIWTGAYQYWKSVHPDNLIKADAPQMGGSEGAALAIAQALANQGDEVLLGCKVAYAESFGNLRVCPLDLFPLVVYAGSYDVLVSWDEPRIFRYNLDHIPTKILVFQLNDTHIGIYDYIVDRYLHPSHWHARRFRELYDLPFDKQVIGCVDGVDPRLFQGMPARQNHVVWASSPDRGLHHLLRMWPRILEQVPDAQLHIYYDMDGWLSKLAAVTAVGATTITSDRATEIQRVLPALSNVVYHGGVSKVELAAAFLSAKVMAYTCEPVAPTEGFSMTTLEAWTAGCDVIISDADALQELWGDRSGIMCLPLPIDDDLWVAQIVQGLEASVLTGPRLVPPDLTWDAKADQWRQEAMKCR